MGRLGEWILDHLPPMLRASTDAVRDVLRAPEDGADEGSGLLKYVGDADRELDAQSPRSIEEAILDVAVAPELADAIAEPSEAQAFTGAEMAADRGLEFSGGIEPGGGR